MIVNGTHQIKMKVGVPYQGMENQNYNPRRIINRAQMLPSPSPRITQPNLRGRFHQGKFSSHTTPEISFNHDHNSIQKPNLANDLKQ